MNAPSSTVARGAGSRHAASRVLVVADEALGRYGFPNGHPFGPDRLAAFLGEFRARQYPAECLSRSSRLATDDELRLFHAAAHVEFVRTRSLEGTGSLDGSDTPAWRGCFEAAARVVGATLEAGSAILAGEARRAFVPIAGLHHAVRERAAGFCIFNDCGVLIEWLRQRGIVRIAYVDIDAHHGDGVYYPYESDPDLIIVDFHEDGDYLYPGTGRADEQGLDAAVGSKLNLPLQPGDGDSAFAAFWPQAMAHLERFQPEFVILQCGADSLAGDPLAHLSLSPASFALAASELAALADRLGHGRVLAVGGGGYNRANIAAGWNAMVGALLQA